MQLIYNNQTLAMLELFLYSGFVIDCLYIKMNGLSFNILYMRFTPHLRGNWLTLSFGYLLTLVLIFTIWSSFNIRLCIILGGLGYSPYPTNPSHLVICGMLWEQLKLWNSIHSGFFLHHSSRPVTYMDFTDWNITFFSIVEFLAGLTHLFVFLWQPYGLISLFLLLWNFDW